MDWTLLGIPAGVIFLYIGSEVLVDGGKKMALKLGVTPFVIGLTVLAFGSSAPEAITSVVSRDNPGLIIGNVVGSNIVNIAVCIGLAAIICPMASKFADNRIDFITMILAALLLFAFAFGGVGLAEGLVLLACLLVYLLIVYKSKINTDEAAEEPEEVSDSMPKCIIFVVLGLVLLYFGSEMFVDGAKDVATMMGVSDLLIGLFLVAIGTSLPELCISVMAAVRHENDIAISNIIGSNIFNCFFVLGIGSTISNIPVFDSLIQFHIPVMILLTVMMAFFVWRYGRISRVSGALLAGVYAAYAVTIICVPGLAM